MRHISKRLLGASVICLIAGFAISWAIMSFILDTSLRLYGFTYLSAVAVLFAVLLLVLLDRPLALNLFEFSKDTKKSD